MSNFRRYEVQRGAKASGRNHYYSVSPGFDHQDQKKVALHFLHPQFFEEADAAEANWKRLLEATQVRDKHLIAVLDADEEQRLVVTEWCGRSLKEMLRDRPLSPVQVREVLRQTLMGLARLHGRRITHGDVRPATMLIDDQSVVRLAFSPGMTFADAVPMRTEHQKYMAPELLNPAEFGEPGAPADLYAAGLSALELLMGTPAFEAAFQGVRGEGELRDQSWMQWHAAPGSKLAPVRALVPSIPEDLEYVIQGLLVKSRKDRYEDAEKALKDLEPPGIVDTQGSRGGASNVARPPRRRSDGKGSGNWIERNLGLVCALILIPAVLYLFMPDPSPDAAGTCTLKLQVEPAGVLVSLAEVPAEFQTRDQVRTAGPRGGVRPLLNKEAAPIKEKKVGPGHYYLGVTPPPGSDLVEQVHFFDILKTETTKEVKVTLVKPVVHPEVTVETVPPGADVIAGGNRKGVTPFKQRIPEGEWTIELKLAGYQPRKEVIKVTKTATRFGPFPLEKETADFSVATEPAGAVLSWAGVGPEAKSGESKTPISKHKLPIGKYLLKISLPGYHPLEQKLELAVAGESKDLGKVTLQPAARLVQVSTLPPGARVRALPEKPDPAAPPPVDKVSPFSDLALPVGKYQLESEKPGYVTTRTALEVVAGTTPQTVPEIVLQALPRPVRIESTPAGAAVEIHSMDGTKVTTSTGTTPMAGITLMPGKYQIAMKLAGYADRMAEISLEGGTGEQVIGPVELGRLMRKISIAFHPPQADLAIQDASGKPVHTAAVAADRAELELPVGEYTVLLKKPLCQDLSTKIAVEEGLDVQVFGPFELAPVERMVRVVSKPEGAEVSLDGKTPAGLTPAEVPLTVARHWLKLELPGYESSETFLDVEAGEGVQEVAVIELRPRKRTVRFQVEPPGAALRLAGDTQARDPEQPFELDPGTYAMELTARGFQNFSSNVEVLPGVGEQLLGPFSLSAFPRSVKILSIPDQATVTVDDQPLTGTTPVDHELAVGEHWVKIQLPGHGVFEELLMVEAGEGQQVLGPFTLQQLPRKIRISSQPDGAQVTVDGQAQSGPTPLDLDLEPGKYFVKLIKPGYKEASEVLQVTAATDPIELGPVRLEALPRQVVVQVTPPDAVVLCDGSPLLPAGALLPVGEHRLEISHPKCLPHSQAFQVEAGEGTQTVGPIPLRALEVLTVTVAPPEAEVTVGDQVLAAGTSERLALIPPGKPVKIRAAAEGFQPQEAELAFHDLEKAEMKHRIQLAPGLPAGLIPREGTAMNEALKLPMYAVSKRLSDAGCPLEFVLIAPGDFRHGVPSNQSLEPGELPESTQSIKTPYYIALSEVTAEQYATFAREAGDTAAGVRWRDFSTRDLPALQVAHDQAQRFADWLAPKHGRLPTEVEWEAAARGPTGSLQPWGEGEADATRARLHFDDTMRLARADDLPAGDSPLGIHHLMGNVAEWCQDLYQPGEGEGAGHPGVGTWPAIRGGSWKTLPIGVRATWRASMDPQGGDDVGIRVVVGIGP